MDNTSDPPASVTPEALANDFDRMLAGELPGAGSPADLCDAHFDPRVVSRKMRAFLQERLERIPSQIEHLVPVADREFVFDKLRSEIATALDKAFPEAT